MTAVNGSYEEADLLAPKIQELPTESSARDGPTRVGRDQSPARRPLSRPEIDDSDGDTATDSPARRQNCALETIGSKVINLHLGIPICSLTFPNISQTNGVGNQFQKKPRVGDRTQPALETEGPGHGGAKPKERRLLQIPTNRDISENLRDNYHSLPLFAENTRDGSQQNYRAQIDQCATIKPQNLPPIRGFRSKPRLRIVDEKGNIFIKVGDILKDLPTFKVDVKREKYIANFDARGRLCGFERCINIGPFESRNELRITENNVTESIYKESE